VTNLASNATHQNIDVQRSAVQTLGYICEKLAASSLKPSIEEVEAIIGGVAAGLREGQANDQIRITAIKALQDSLPIFKEELGQEKVREFLLGEILKNSSHSNDEVSLKSVQCLIDIVKSSYIYLSKRYMDVILDRTAALLQKNSPSIVIASTEFWHSLASYEIQQLNRQRAGDTNSTCHYFIKNYSQPITKLLLENLMKKDTEDDSGLSIHTACLDCLIRVNNLSYESNKDLNISFISNQIGSDNERAKVAALLCFEAMILGYDEDIVQLIDASFKNILEFLKVNPVVCKAALKVISAISERYPGFMLIDRICSAWLEILLKILHSELRFSRYICTILESKAGLTPDIGKAVSSRDVQQGEFISKTLEVIKMLVEICFTKCNPNQLYIVNHCFLATMSLAISLKSVQSCNEVLEFCNKCLLNTHNLSKDMRNAIRDGLLITSMVLLQ
jgi:importin subunit beta-1